MRLFTLILVLVIWITAIWWHAAPGTAIPPEPIHPIKSANLTLSPEIEASGLLYLDDLDRYLVISDETKGHQPVLYLMDARGQVDQVVLVQGIDRIDDMESVCKGDSRDIYICCSQSLNKKGEISADRKLLLRLTQNGVKFEVSGKVFLYDLLEEAIRQSHDEQLKQLIHDHKGLMGIDIEGMFYLDGAIYLGLKKPLAAGKAIILKISSIERMFRENQIPEKGIMIWRTFALKDDNLQIPTGISDLFLYRNRLFILSYASIEKYFPLSRTELKKFGLLWEYDLKKDRLRLIETFRNMQPEGVVASDKTCFALHIVFDGGGSVPSGFLDMPQQ